MYSLQVPSNKRTAESGESFIFDHHSSDIFESHDCLLARPKFQANDLVNNVFDTPPAALSILVEVSLVL